MTYLFVCCVKDSSWSGIDCKRENGHRFSVKRVLVNNYIGSSGGYEYKAICNKCGEEADYCFSSCS